VDSQIITTDLVDHIRAQFQLDWGGIHGAGHWARVRVNGLRLARETGADTRIVELFAFLHDARRQSEGGDPEHGSRAARWVRTLNGSFFELQPRDLRLLEAACRDHSLGYRQANVTIQTCWDADRLDLGRIGIRPDPEYLCTRPARELEVIEWAFQRSRGRP
jgi:uncharacterized protein